METFQSLLGVQEEQNLKNHVAKKEQVALKVQTHWQAKSESQTNGELVDHLIHQGVQ